MKTEQQPARTRKFSGQRPSHAGLALDALRSTLRAVVVRTEQIEIRPYEIASADVLRNELCPAVLAIVSESRTALEAVLDHCEVMRCYSAVRELPTERSDKPQKFERHVDAALEHDSGIEGVEEVAFIAGIEMRERDERLRGMLNTQFVLELVSEADSALRRVRKGLSAVEASIASVLKTAPLLEFRSELEMSLAARRAYAAFLRSLDLRTQPGPTNLYSRFRGAGIQIAVLIGRDVYPDLRVKDRLLLRDLQQRILTWLRQGDQASPREGLRLWQDFVACIELFSLINRRAELMAHDAALSVRLDKELGHGSQPIEPAQWTQLERLRGLDTELDAELERGARHAPLQVRAHLRRIAAGFSRASQGSADQAMPACW